MQPRNQCEHEWLKLQDSKNHFSSDVFDAMSDVDFHILHPIKAKLIDIRDAVWRWIKAHTPKLLNKH